MSTISQLTKASNIYDISIGQYITCDYTVEEVNKLGTLNNINSSVSTNSTTIDSTIGDISFNFICIGRSNIGDIVLLADRVIQTSISATELNTKTLLTTTGYDINIDGVQCTLKVPYIDMYNRAILNGEATGLEPKDDIWNTNIASWTYNIPTTATSVTLATLGGETPETVNYCTPDTSNSTLGFRPVLYIHIPIKYKENIDIPSYIEVVDSPSKLAPGKAIKCEYTVEGENTFGVFGNLGKSTKDLLPEVPISTPDGSFYFICIGYSPEGYLKCVADRNIQSSVSFNTLFNAGLGVTTGVATKIDNYDVIMRIPMSISNRHINIANGTYGEFDAIFTLYNKFGIQKASNEVWNFKHSKCFTMSILSYINETTVADKIYIITRGMQDTGDISETEDEPQSYLLPDAISTTTGFRPIICFNNLTLEDGSVITDKYTRGRVGTKLPIYTGDNTLRKGMAVSCEYTSTTNTFGEFKNLARASKDHILAEGEENPDGTFYWIFVGYTPEGYKKFVADRNIQTNIAFDTLVSSHIELVTTTGWKTNIDGITVYMRLPMSSSLQVINENNYGEWDAIISMYKNDIITTPSDPEVWNCEYSKSFTMSLLGLDRNGNPGDGTRVISRGGQNKDFDISSEEWQIQGIVPRTNISASVGFRPIMWVEEPIRDKENPYVYFVNKHVYGNKSLF